MATGPTPQTAAVNDWAGAASPLTMRVEPARAAPGGRSAVPGASLSGAALSGASLSGASLANPAIARSVRWGPARLAAVERLWGEGFNAPGGAAEILRLTSPMALCSGNTLLLLGGALGGPAQAVAENTGAFVSSFEADAELTALARQRTAAQACCGRIAVGSWDPEKPAFGVRTSDHALSVEALRGADPAMILDSLASSLRPNSQIVMTEMVASEPAPETDREYAAWCRLENRVGGLPRGEMITDALHRLHYDVRVVEDVSAAHVTAALAGWRQAVQAMGSGPAPTPAAAGIVVTEAELWLLRIRVMRRFGLRLLRWHAVGLP
jgi:hypothetical protein